MEALTGYAIVVSLELAYSKYKRYEENTDSLYHISDRI